MLTCFCDNSECSIFPHILSAGSCQVSVGCELVLEVYHLHSVIYAVQTLLMWAENTIQVQALGVILQPVQQVLDLSCCRGVGDAGVAAVAAAGARLHTLNLSSCHRLTDAAFAALGARCSALAHLNACGCELLGDAGLAALAAGARCWPSGLLSTK